MVFTKSKTCSKQ